MQLAQEAARQAHELASPPEAPRKTTAREYLESLVVTVVLALFGTTFLLQAFKIPSSSMEDTLLIGDHLMVDKVSYAPSPAWEWLLPYHSVERDRIIVFRYPLDPKTYFVKRVIGLPGDRIRLVNKLVYRNDEPINEPYAIHKSSRLDEYRDNFPDSLSRVVTPDWAVQWQDYIRNDEVIVPPGYYFVMGDNRDFSSDSRYWGFVPRENIVGDPLVIYWSFETSGDEYRRTSLGDYLGRLLEITLNLPQKTRWDRMFRLVK
ncbi:MAG: signal peptidase I [Acidobacteria bacterium]|nr:signal peptidase I [Acidobacteriota bacterium]